MISKKDSQDIKWLKEDIDQDRDVLTTSDGESFHEDRLLENLEKLEELCDAVGIEVPKGYEQD